ncbi:pimeloyl-ACP methyl ester carboxylesterase [Actinocorallia herbida]|uniref:Pimeloyl-ACP methyl ester carboxylesterase n=1 Tax=Actinocorallia herbida TaxID=58109 RepID=A0A3N1D2A8_9ACTN|nr:alpha/beta hydrolase [Actinocorallia herbida]ROO87665.1 pimeloyl-ACP methyl ester carboxylesterase [Actinocorallia herbida]
MRFDRKCCAVLSAGVAAVSLAVVPTVAVRSMSILGGADPGGGSPAATGEPFGTVKQIDAGELNVGYVDAGPADGPPVILLHGFPYDIHSFEKVTPILAGKGYRVVVPYLRGHGTTTFRSPDAVRNAEQSAFAVDIVALMDALKIDKATLAGFDWGSRTADIIAALWPERVKNLVSVSGYLITNRKAQKEPQKPPVEHTWWYQYYFATPRGEKGLAAYRHDFGEFVWRLASPTWDFDQKTYDRTAAAFENPDWVPIVIHNYRWRLSLAEGQPAYAGLEAKLATSPKITVPTITVDATLDPFGAGGSDAAYRAQFTGPYQHRVLKGIGHDVPQEAPEAFAQAVIDAGEL